jgi:hypothetical protein
MAELQALKSGGNEDSEALIKEIEIQEKQIRELQAENERVKEEKEVLEVELEKIR